jgi:hypothetical protein
MIFNSPTPCFNYVLVCVFFWQSRMFSKTPRLIKNSSHTIGKTVYSIDACSVALQAAGAMASQMAASLPMAASLSDFWNCAAFL